MKPIKFRGYDTQDGVREMVTFTLADLLAGSEDYELVDPDTVAQLVGYDANGKEVYEGDILIDKNGYEFVATIQSVGCCKSAASIPVESRPVDFDLIQRFTPLTLKEDNQ